MKLAIIKNDRGWGTYWVKLLLALVIGIIGLSFWTQPLIAAEIKDNNANTASIAESLAIKLVKDDRCLSEMGERGIAACQQSIALHPKKSGYWNNLGSKYFQLGRYRDALNAYDRALSIEPNYSLGLANKCATLSLLSRYRQALESCDLALQGNGKWGLDGAALAWDNRGDVLFNLKRYRESLASFDRALRLNPNYSNARKNHNLVLNKLQSNWSEAHGNRLRQLIHQHFRAKSFIGSFSSFRRRALDDASLGRN
jgi:tetratricopeptide (TPR) repeat protein